MSIESKQNKPKLVVINFVDIPVKAKNGEIVYTRIDKEDEEKATKYKWQLSATGYVVGISNNKRVRLHRLIMGCESGDGKIVDHINHNRLDNRKCNLVYNARNCAYIKKSSGVVNFQGIRLHGSNYGIRILKDTCVLNFGSFSELNDAKSACIQIYDILLGDRSPHKDEKIPNTDIKVVLQGRSIVITRPQNKPRECITNTSGVVGLSLSEKDKKLQKPYRASKEINGKKYVQYFATREEAIKHLEELQKIPIETRYNLDDDIILPGQQITPSKDEKKVIIDNSYVEILIGEGDNKTIVKVDSQFADLIKQYKWSVLPTGRIRGCVDGKRVLMHRFLKGCKPGDGKIIDHINHDQADNRLSNLKENPRNQFHQIHKRGSLAFQGVACGKGKYYITITKDTQVYKFGAYDVFDDAKSACIQIYDILLGDRSPHINTPRPQSTVKVWLKDGKIYFSKPQNAWVSKGKSGIAGVMIEESGNFIVQKTINSKRYVKMFPPNKEAEMRAYIEDLKKIPREIAYTLSDNVVLPE